MDREELRLWRRRPETIPALAERYLPLVRKIAGNVARRVPFVDVGDLVGWGAVGLMRAVESFDLGRGILPGTHLGIRIRGAMLDGLRETPRDGRPAPKRRDAGVSVHLAGCGNEGAESPLSAVAAPPDDSVDVFDLEEAVARFLVGRDRELVVRTLIRGERVRDVGESLGISPSMAGQILARGERRLMERREKFARALGLET